MSFRKIIGIATFAALGATTVYGMGCSSSTNSGAGTDSGAPKTDTGAPKQDSSVMDTGGGDSSGGDSGGDSGSGMCPDNTPFTAIMWAPPTPLHQGACTTAQINAWQNSQNMMTGIGMSGNAACDACIATPETASKHGPIVTQMGNLAEFNLGGCLADLDGQTAAGSCGNQLNNAQDCIGQECNSCSDSMMPAKGGPFDTCDQTVLGTSGSCAKDGVTMACDAEITGTGIAATTCLSISSNVEFFTVWCGAATAADGGTDGGADTSTPPGDTGGGG